MGREHINENNYFNDLYQKGELTDEVIDYLIKYDIGLEYLAHLPLSNNQLLALYLKNRQLCEESAFTLINRALEDNMTVSKATNQEFNSGLAAFCLRKY